MLQFLVDKHGFVFKTFDDKREAASEFKRFYKAGYDVHLESLEDRSEFTILYKRDTNNGNTN
tara:strand:- start:2470 stop:2655 length:186 start_codon:yes stop_codon:yes gene_type:complete